MRGLFRASTFSMSDLDMLGLFLGLNPEGCGGEIKSLTASFAFLGGLISSLSALGRLFFDEIFILIDDCRLVFKAGESTLMLAVASANCSIRPKRRSSSVNSVAGRN